MAVAGTTEDGGTGLCFAVLGPLQVTRCGERLPLGGRQQRAVLALLLAESGMVVSVGRLGDALWGEETPSGFVTTVQTYVFHLRQVLEPDRGHGARGRVLVTEPGGYRLDAEGSIVDTAVFERSVHAGRAALDRHAYEEASAELERALGLWRGEVLADVADLGFVGPIAARLETMRMIAHGLRIEAELALGRHADVLPEVDRLVAEHPLQEQLHAQRMTALYRVGRRSDALAAYVPKKQFTLKRNPHFRQWSFAAQPAGYPDVIDFRTVPDGKAAAEQVIAGGADVADLSPMAAALRADLARRYPAQFKNQGLAQTDFEYLNTRMAPFDDVRVRRALNYAVDRTRLVAIRGSSANFSATCQILPPNFPSYRWYCPYTTGLRDGLYHGPNLRKARELVSLSGTRGMVVTVQGTAQDHELNAYFATVLRQLGYPVKLRELPESAHYDSFEALKQVQITSGAGWIADYPVAATFFDSVFSCRTAVGKAGWYCNPKVERLAAQAHAAELFDPGKAGRLWTEIDRVITNDAPVVALGNASWSTLVSARVGNYQSNRSVGPLLSQIWVK